MSNALTFKSKLDQISLQILHKLYYNIVGWVTLMCICGDGKIFLRLDYIRLDLTNLFNKRSSETGSIHIKLIQYLFPL